MQDSIEKAAGAETVSLSPEKSVIRAGDRVIRPAEPWSAEKERFLRHLESRSLPVEHLLTVEEEQEIYAFSDGELVHPQKWTDEALFAVGRLVRELHDAGREFRPVESLCKPWCLREIGKSERIWCHGDIAPWNMLTQNGMPYRLVDWEYAGPLDPMVEWARVCWLFPQLVDDDLQALYDLPSPEKRAEQVKILCEGYGLPRGQRLTLVEQILEVVICETAHEAIDPGLTFDSFGCLWGFAWRTRSLYWIWRNRRTLSRILLGTG